MKDQFRRREPERVYWAVVYGHPQPPEGTWRDHLVWDSKALIQKRTHPGDAQGKEAISHYRVIESLPDASLLEVRLETGKRNQIRIQARLRGHTLVGEQRYVFGPESLRPIAFPRQALHAYRLSFRHPADGRPLSFEAPLPADLAGLAGAPAPQAPHPRTTAVRSLTAGCTFSARGPFGPWPTVKLTVCPSRMSSNRVLVQADWWKKYSVPSPAAMNPNPLSFTIRLIVPVIVAIDLSFRRWAVEP